MRGPGTALHGYLMLLTALAAAIPSTYFLLRRAAPIDGDPAGVFVLAASAVVAIVIVVTASAEHTDLP